MKKSQLQNLIREEVKRTLTEAVKLPKDMSITHIRNKEYTLEYSKFQMEPTIPQAEKIAATLRSQFSKIATTVQANAADGLVTIYVREGDIAIGLGFTSKLSHSEMSKLVGGINYAD